MGTRAETREPETAPGISSAEVLPVTIENNIRVLAGSLVLLSLILTLAVSPYFLVLTGLVGLNLVQSAFTGFCPAESMLRKMRPPR